jgi:two-component system sensor histidine kinase YesM
MSIGDMQKRNKHGMLRLFIIVSAGVCAFSFGLLTAQIFITTKLFTDTTRAALKTTHDHALYNISDFLNNMGQLAYSLCYNPTVQQYMKAVSPLERFRIYDDLTSVLSGVTLIEDDIRGITLLDKDSNIVASQGNDYRSHASYGSIAAGNGISYVSGNELDIEGKEHYIHIIYPIYSLGTDKFLGELIGGVCVTLIPAYFNLEVNVINSYTGAGMAIIDSGKRSITANTYFTYETLENVLPPGKSSFVTFTSEIADTNWNLVTYMPFGFIVSELSFVFILSLAIGLSIWLMFMFLAILLYRKIVQPIGKISAFMSTVSMEKSGAVPSFPVEENSYREIYAMVAVLNEMLRSLDEQKDKLLQKDKDYYTAVLAGNRMELMAYRNQINPHFLYNTLATVKGIAMYYGVSEIEEISECLSTIFRYVVKGGNYVTVNDEIEHVKKYALIIGYRFQNRIQISCDVDEGASEMRILRLIIQPLVENAVVHGIERKAGEGHISVKAVIRENRLEISVKDDGIGMSGEKLSAIRQKLKDFIGGITDEHGENIGLQNIIRRMRIFYGDGYSLHIDSETDRGTIVTMLLPAYRFAPEEENA